MPLNLVKIRTSERFNEVQVFLNFIGFQEPPPGHIVPLETNIMKGLFYVHLYSAFEKSINDAVENILMLISAKNIKNNHLQAPVLSIALTNQIKSLKDCSYKKVFSKSSEVFIEAASTNVSPLNETVFSKNLQNIWVKTIEEIALSLGMSSIPMTPRERLTINEIVEKRNAVAHGRDSAASIGERYRVDKLREKHEIISNVTQLIIDELEIHYDTKKYIKPMVRRLY